MSADTFIKRQRGWEAPAKGCAGSMTQVQATPFGGLSVPWTRQIAPEHGSGSFCVYFFKLSESHVLFLSLLVSRSPGYSAVFRGGSRAFLGTGFSGRVHFIVSSSFRPPGFLSGLPD